MFSVDHKSAVHTGGTKFYGIVTISDGSHSVLVTHWGKYPGKIPTPANSQDEQIATFATDLGADREGSVKQSEKQKRGYTVWKKSSQRLADEVELSNWAMTNLNHEHAKEVVTLFGITGTPKAKKPEPAPTTPKREPSIPKPADWGSW